MLQNNVQKGYVNSKRGFCKILENGKVGDSRIHQPVEKLIKLSKESKCLIFSIHTH